MVGLATSRDYPELTPDDLGLASELKAAGLTVQPLVWDLPNTPPPAHDAVVIRSTWDYYRKLPEFLGWVEATSARTRLFNPPATVRWNSNKTYLRELESSGVAIVPTAWASEEPGLESVRRARGWGTVVVKPAVSAAGDRTYRIGPEDGERGQAVLAGLLKSGEALIQPFMEGVAGRGERSLIYLGGEFSHAVVRKTKFSSPSAPEEGQPTAPTAREREVADGALAALRRPWLYARVDLVEDAEGRPRLMELELIEPHLYFASAPGSARRLASCLSELLAV